MKPRVPFSVVGPVANFLVILAFSLYFYGYARSFPLISDDGAANYVSMLHALRAGGLFNLTFPIKWFEGLGQPNMFYSSLFDPFNWLMLGPLPDADAFRISYAVRAAFLWLTTFLFVARLLPGATAIAMTAGSLNFVLCYPLGSPGSVPAWAGIHHMTQLVLLPAVLWLYLGLMRQRTWLGIQDALLTVALALFLLNYPLNSLMGLVVIIGFAFIMVLCAGRADRAWAFKAFLKLILVSALLLFMPKVGFFDAWTAVTSGSARLVLNNELNTLLTPGYELPNFWRYGQSGVQVLILFSLAIILCTRPIPWPALVVPMTLFALVAAIQVATLVYAHGLLPLLFRRLPAPSRVEFYLTAFYAFCAAYALCNWRDVLLPSSEKLLRWSICLGLFSLGAWLLVDHRIAACVLIAGSLIAAALLVDRYWPQVLRGAVDALATFRVRSGFWVDTLMPTSVVLALLTGSMLLWFNYPNHVHAPFGPELACKHQGGFWCEDAPGTTLNAAATPVTNFLRSSLVSIEGPFRGRAEFLVSPDIADATDPRGRNFRDMTRESEANFKLGRNGMVLLALPFQGISVASSYEQVQDYLYTLFWSRYVNQGLGIAPTVNFTTLSSVSPQALALIGVRYVVVRDSPLLRPFGLTLVYSSGAYGVYEIPAPNLTGYSPSRIEFGDHLADELKRMRDGQFDPRITAVIPAADKVRIGALPPLSAMTDASVILRGQTLEFSARSASGRSLAVLPFRFSHCWIPEWEGMPGQLLRTDVALLGVLFEHQVKLKLRWGGGYGRSNCFRADAALRVQGREAAAQVPY
jgi:hypothetical protein